MKPIKISILILMILTGCIGTDKSNVEINVDTSKILYTMKGGLGASWHSLSKETPLENEKYKFPVRVVCPRGSGYGGNPPITDTLAWNGIREHASWLGLNFLRVELSQNIYEPERNKFDWENEEMQALYLILDWCQENNADVFLQQMWGHVEWNSFPGVHPIISAPKNLDDFAEGIATLLEYLTQRKGYTCIKYFCMTNEPPGGPWGYWWEAGDGKCSINDAWKRLKVEFDKRKIDIPISGPDWTSMPPFDESKLVFAPYLGSFDIHSYDGVTESGEANLKNWADWAHKQDKPFFLTEFGNMNLGWGTDNPGPKSFDAALSNANDVFRAIRAGVDGFNRWSFTNRGDLDGQWQLIQTFDREKKEYIQDVKPENEAYYGFGIISRFLSKYSSSVSCSVNQPDSVLMAVAMRSPSGQLSIFILNKGEKELKSSLKIQGQAPEKLTVYKVSKELVNQPGFELNPMATFKSNDRLEVILAPKSITTITSYLLTNNDNGVMLN